MCLQGWLGQLTPVAVHPRRRGQFGDNVARDDTPRYNRSIVEARMLKVAGERNPSHLTEDELIGEIVADRRDEGEVDTASRAITGLREFDLATPRGTGSWS